ncbi:MAG: endonuclease III [Bacteroidia bacterium]|jgi:endonuclease-3
MTIKERYGFVVNYFSEHRPQAETELAYNNPFELLVAVILSAQCTDKRVNLITPALFQRFPDALQMASASVDEIFLLIRSVSYPNNKAKHLKGMAEMLLRDFNGEVPERIEDLVKLPGVGRKTANVIASVVFNQAAMAVDTHVFRVSARLGLTRNAKTPLEAEKQLMKHLPNALVPLAHHWLILHGRYVCMARNPACAGCDLKEICLHFSGKKGIKTSLSKPAKGKQSATNVVKKKNKSV